MNTCICEFEYMWNPWERERGREKEEKRERGREEGREIARDAERSMWRVRERHTCREVKRLLKLPGWTPAQCRCWGDRIPCALWEDVYGCRGHGLTYDFIKCTYAWIRILIKEVPEGSYCRCGCLLRDFGEWTAHGQLWITWWFGEVTGSCQASDLIAWLGPWWSHNQMILSRLRGMVGGNRPTGPTQEG